MVGRGVSGFRILKGERGEIAIKSDGPRTKVEHRDLQAWVRVIGIKVTEGETN